jgi:membrane fusion protein (multidrug efflux system)
MSTTDDGTMAGGTTSTGVRGLLADPIRKRRVLMAGLAVALLVAAGAWYHFSGQVTTDDAQIDGHITPVSPRVGGTVLAVYVAANQMVAAGAPLVDIDPKDYQVALTRAEADVADAEAAARGATANVPIVSTTTASQLASAQAGVERARAGLAAATARLGSAEARGREARAGHERTARDLERMKPLIAKDEISQQQFDAAVLSEQGAAAALDAAQGAVEEARQARDQTAAAVAQAEAELRTAGTAPQQLETSQARAASAQARLAQAHAALEQARLNLAYTKVVAPAAGVVSRKSVEPGQTVQAGQPLLAIVSLGEIWVTANFKETQLERMHVGQAAVAKVDAYGRSYRGRVESIAGATGARFSLLPAENATGNYVKVVQRVPVRIMLDGGQDAEHVLRPGMSVVATVRVR